MSLTYSKNQLKSVYEDPKGTVEKFSIVYQDGLSEYPTKLYSIVMYITNSTVVFRNMYDPAKLKHSFQNSFFLSVNYKQIVNVKIDGIPIQFINIDNFNSLMSCNLSITFIENKQTYNVNFNFSRFLVNKKNIVLAREIINGFYSVSEFCNLFPKEFPLFQYRIFCKIALPHKNILCEMLAFNKSVFISSKNDNSINMHIDLSDIISCKKTEELQKSHRTVNQIIWFTIRFKEKKTEGIVVFSSASIKFGAGIELEMLLNKLGINIM